LLLLLLFAALVVGVDVEDVVAIKILPI